MKWTIRFGFDKKLGGFMPMARHLKGEIRLIAVSNLHCPRLAEILNSLGWIWATGRDKGEEIQDCVIPCFNPCIRQHGAVSLIFALFNFDANFPILVWRIF